MLKGTRKQPKKKEAKKKIKKEKPCLAMPINCHDKPRGKARQSKAWHGFLLERIIMETDTFTYIWALLNPQGEYKRREQACRRLWLSYDQNKQRAIYHAIRDKQRQGAFVNPNPYFAIEDNAIGMAARLPFKQPTNYNGARSFPDVPLVRAIYNGVGGIYTLREAEMYRMEIKGDFEL